MNQKQAMLDQLRTKAASGGPVGTPDTEIPGLPAGFKSGEGLGKISPEELVIAKQIIKSLKPEVLGALFSMPEKQLIDLLTKELKKNQVQDVDIPDIINLVLSIGKEMMESMAPPAPEGQPMPGPQGPPMPMPNGPPNG